MKQKFMENKKFRLIAMLLITVLIVSGFSFAWFIMRTTDVNQQLSVSNFQATPVCFFEDSSGNISAVNKNADGSIKLSLIENDANYIGKFRVKVEHSGNGSGYLRVKMVHKFSLEGKSAQHSAYVPYTNGGKWFNFKYEKSDRNNTESKWYDNRGNDYCLYYKEVLKGDGTLTLIDGVDEDELSKINSAVEISVVVEADMVQVNRYPQIWGIDHLPWT